MNVNHPKYDPHLNDEIGVEEYKYREYLELNPPKPPKESKKVLYLAIDAGQDAKSAARNLRIFADMIEKNQDSNACGFFIEHGISYDFQYWNETRVTLDNLLDNDNE